MAYRHAVFVGADAELSAVNLLLRRECNLSACTLIISLSNPTS